MQVHRRIRSAGGAHRNAGFTLIEVLLVVAILGMLAGVVVVSFRGRDKSARIATTRTSISAICLALDLYEVDNGVLPATLQGLMQSGGEPNWNGPYIRGAMPIDAWGTAFNYAKVGDKGYEVRSAGPDRQMGSSDDITSQAVGSEPDGGSGGGSAGG